MGGIGESSCSGCGGTAAVKYIITRRFQIRPCFTFQISSSSSSRSSSSISSSSSRISIRLVTVGSKKMIMRIRLG